MTTKGRQSGGEVTIYVVLCCIVAAGAGSMFGYSIGISGGVTSMDTFLLYFFPTVYEKKQAAYESNYCKFSDPLLQAFTSSMYVAGLFTTFVACRTTQKLGRRPTMLIASCLYTMGVALLTFAQNVTMLILGRIVVGCSLGFGNQAAPIYLSEVAPVKLRGGLGLMFQLFITGGILVAEIVNFGTQHLSTWGWRMSFGLGAVPSFLSIAGCLFLCETPNSLIERGHLDQGKAILEKIRGTNDVGDEFQELLNASALSAKVIHPFRNMLKRQNIPPLVMGIMLQVFQQIGGINAIMFYAPVLFETLKFGSNAALYSAVLTGAMNFISTIVSMFLVDRFGRRFILLSAGGVLFFTQTMVGILLGIGLKETGSMPHIEATITVLMICLFVFAFALSWGPMGWLVPSEMFPLAIRSAGQSIVVCTNLLFAFLMAQAFLSLLCELKYKIFIIFGILFILMTAFVYYLVPETKGIPIDATIHLWTQHQIWKKVVNEGSDQETAASLLS